MHSGDRINGSCFDAWDGEELERQQGLRCKSRKRGPAGRQETPAVLHFTHLPMASWSKGWHSVTGGMGPFLGNCF